MVSNIKTTDEFNHAIKKDRLVVVDFYATWCGPCKVIAPKIVEFDQAHDNVDFIKVDVDEVCDVAAEYSIRNMPTFLFFKDGKQVDSVVGADHLKLKKKIEEHAQSSASL